MEQWRWIWCVVAGSFFAAAFDVQPAAAVDYHSVHRDDATTLARVIVGEAGERPGEETWAILHVLEYRRTHRVEHDLSLTEVALRYCPSARRAPDVPRAFDLSQVIATPLPDLVRAQVAGWLRGRRPPSPCAYATAFASRSYVAARGLTPLVCTVATRNAFVVESDSSF